MFLRFLDRNWLASQPTRRHLKYGDGKLQLKAIKDEIKALKLGHRAKCENIIIMVLCINKAKRISYKLDMYSKLKSDKELCEKLIQKLPAACQNSWH